MQAAGVQHLVGLVGVHGHSRLGEHVLAGGQGCQYQVAVHVGPGADADGIDAVVVEQVGPVVVYRGDFELPGDALPGFAAAVSHGDDLDVALFPEAGDVAQTSVGTGPDQADADHSVHHQTVSFLLPPQSAAWPVVALNNVGQFYHGAISPRVSPRP